MTPSTTISDCREPCRWSGWLDSNYPSSTPEGTDIESIEELWNSHNISCRYPMDIECQAVDYIGVDLSQLEQNVTCDLTNGLVCYNAHQKNFKCFNYHIKVKCCNPACTTPQTTTTTETPSTTTGTGTTTTTETPSTTTGTGTTTTTETPSTTTGTGTTTTETPSTTTGTETTTTTETPSTTTGSVTTTTTETPTTTTGTGTTTTETPSTTTGTGTTTTHETPSTTTSTGTTTTTTETPSTTTGTESTTTTSKTPTTTTGSKTTTTTSHEPFTRSTTTTTPAPQICADCDYLNPSRKDGETWTENCQIKTCKCGNVTSHSQCSNPNPTKPTCVNGFPPAKVYDQSGCCYTYECQCTCNGWGDPHYVTFDGTYYAFQGNCTYVLVQEIIKQYNFTVHIKNYYCDIPNKLACPESLTIFYKTHTIMLKQTRNPLVNTVLVNNTKVTASLYSNADFTITTTVIAMTVTIPEIKATVDFRGMNFGVTLPYSLFHNNTEGQCGVCDNNRTNDCRLPNGTIPSCESGAGYWQVNTSVPCSTPPPPPPCVPLTNSKCNIIKTNEAFKKCNAIIPSESYFRACQYDECHMGENATCASLEQYAKLCAEHSICVDWRPLTNNLCPFNCSSDKVYKACGPKVESTCDSMFNQMFANCNSQECQNKFREGCYCPTGTTLFSTTSNKCTKSCSCVDADGHPKQPGEKWQMNCQDCECSMDIMGPKCKNISCPNPDSCNQLGYQIKTENCCPKCVCNPSSCPPTTTTCSAGYELVRNNTVGDCCFQFYCKPKHVCVYNNTEYTPGSHITTTSSSCEDCNCDHTMDSSTGLYNVKCNPVSCNTVCSAGYTYVAIPGKCCGECKQTHCTYNGPGTSGTIVIGEGETWTPPHDSCKSFNCTKDNGTYVVVKNVVSCPPFNADNCKSGIITDDGCCKTCKPRDCTLLTNHTILRANNCETEYPVEIGFCAGSCNTESIYSMQANLMMHSCSCCQELKTSQRKVELKCADHSKIEHTYLIVEECGCYHKECTDYKSEVQNQSG